MKLVAMTREQINAELLVLRRSIQTAEINLEYRSKPDSSTRYPNRVAETVAWELYISKWVSRIEKLYAELDRRPPGLTAGPAMMVFIPVFPGMVEVGKVAQEIIYIEPEVGSYIKTRTNPGPGEVANTVVLAVGSRIIKVGN